MRRAALLALSLALVGALTVGPSTAHESLRTGRYECWLSQIGQYSNYDLKIRSGGRYALMLDDDVVGRKGRFVHDGRKLRFTSGYLKRQGYKGKHAVLDDAYDTHMIYLYKGTYDSDDLVYDCNNN